MAYMFPVLTIGFIVIQIISIMLARKVKKHLNERAASYVYLFVAIAAACYLFDVLLHTPHLFTDAFFYFWLSIVLTQLAFFISAKRKKYRL
jgi:hypothetical protein